MKYPGFFKKICKIQKYHGDQFEKGPNAFGKQIKKIQAK